MIYKPPRFFGGYVCQHFARGGRSPVFGLKFNQKLANIPFVIKIIQFVSKYIKRITFAIVEGRKMLATFTF